MSSAHQNLSAPLHGDALPDGKGKKIGIVCAAWNREITIALLDGCKEALLKMGVSSKNIKIMHVPGSFELPYGAARLLQNHPDTDAIITLGCLIRGETIHFEVIAESVANALQSLSLQQLKPCIFGVLTTETEEQAWARAGGKHGNKGEEAAFTALAMCTF